MMAQNALKNCGEYAQKRLLAHEDFFLLGTMGADPYFMGAFPPPVGSRAFAGLGDLLHAADGYRLFTVMLAQCRGDEALIAYTAGALCHFLLDNHTHPYIASRFPDDLHTPAEIAIDALMIARQTDPRFHARPSAVYAADNAAAIDALHARVCRTLFHLRTEGLYRRALKKWLRINDLQFDPYGKKRAFFRPLPGVARYLITPGMPDERDWLNLSHMPWGNPGAAARTESFPTLYAAACREASPLLALIAAVPETFAESPRAHALEGRTADAAEYVRG